MEYTIRTTKETVDWLVSVAEENREEFDCGGSGEYIMLGKIDLARHLCEMFDIEYTPGEVQSNLPDSDEKTLDEEFEEVREEYELLDYEEERYKQFCVDMAKNSLSIRHYNGRNFYSGPAVVWHNVSDIKEKTSILLQWDNMGKDYIIYPK